MMDKYVGKYRVTCEFDMRNLKPIKHDTWVVCKRGGQIYRLDDERLVYYNETARPSIMAKIRPYVVDLIGNSEAGYVFLEKDMEVVAEACEVMTKGKDIPPHYKSNARLMPLYKMYWGQESKYNVRKP